MRKYIAPSLAALLASLTAGFAAEETKPEQAPPALQPMHVDLTPSAKGLPEAKQLDEKDAKSLEELGSRVFQIKWGDNVVAVSDRGFQVVTDGVTTLSYRPTGNAYFLQRKGMDHAFEGPGFSGPAEQLSATGERLLGELGVDRSEIAKVRVLQQFVTAGEADPNTGRVTPAEPRRDRLSLVVDRAVEGIPVWSSRLKLDLDQKGEIAALELSWPKIEPKVMEMARRLEQIAGSDFKPPERAGARVESVEAGILHSPAASFVDEQVAAVRVIYASQDSRLGMKPMIFLDENGNPVQAPRQLIARPEPPTPPRQ